jgi:hypothetical protein
MNTERMLGLAHRMLLVMILLGKFVLILEQIVSGATNYPHVRLLA